MLVQVSLEMLWCHAMMCPVEPDPFTGVKVISIFSYYHDSRCHIGLNKDSPEPREVQSPEKGRIVEIPKVGELHHRYERRAA